MGDHARSPGAVVFFIFYFSNDVIKVSFPPPPPFLILFFLSLQNFPDRPTDLVTSLWAFVLAFHLLGHHIYIIISKTEILQMPMRRTGTADFDRNSWKRIASPAKETTTTTKKRSPFFHAGRQARILQHVFERVYFG